MPDLASQVAAVEAHPNAHRGWAYAPQERRRDILTRNVSPLPYPSRFFGLPKTHTLDHLSSDSADHLDFLVWCIGFFTGYPLRTYEMGCLDAAPIKDGKVSDFFVPEQALPDAIALSERYWETHSKHSLIPRRLTGIINCLFMSRSPLALPHERFLYLYIAIDACYKQAKDQKRIDGRHKHTERIKIMCEHFEMPDPGIEVYGLRNDTIHEALFFKKPLGFMDLTPESKHINRTLMFMHSLVSRLTVALMDAPCKGYITSNAGTRNYHALTFE